jgi:hypothetical protein
VVNLAIVQDKAGFEVLLSQSKLSHGIVNHPQNPRLMEIDTEDPFIGYTNQRGRKTDIT